jgi:hypothetical protein
MAMNGMQGIYTRKHNYHLRLVKPLDLSMGIEEAFLLWGLGTGVPFYMKKYSLFSPV